MSSISSISGVNPAQYARSTTGIESEYDSNARKYGAVAANAIGTAEAVGAGVSAVVNFSSESLQKLGDSIESGYDALKSGASSVVSGIATLAQEGADTVEAAYDSVAGATSDMVDGVSDAASSVVDSISSAVGTVGQYAALGVAAGKQLLSEVA